MKKRELKKRVVIVGGGFAGIRAAKKLKASLFEITLIDKNNHHLFQPLLYQVASAGLGASDIAEPIRSILSNRKHIEVLMDEVTGVDTTRKIVRGKKRNIPYDYLILAPGSKYNYFSHPEWEKQAPSLKTIEDALNIRKKVLIAFENAEMAKDNAEREAYLNFVIVGGGPTGVELAGSLAELSRQALKKDFKNIDPKKARILLVEMGKKILPSFDSSLSQKALKALQRLGVEVKTESTLEEVTEKGVVISGKFFPSKTVLWAAGVVAAPIKDWIKCETDRVGRVKVLSDLSVPHYPEIFVLGDAAYVEQKGKLLPGIAPVAIQQGKYIATLLKEKLEGKVTKHFHYFDKGQLATIGRSFAVAEIGKLRLSGFFAWLLWLAVHIFFLIDFQNRVLVFTQWAWSYFTFRRGARVILFEDLPPSK